MHICFTNTQRQSHCDHFGAITRIFNTHTLTQSLLIAYSVMDFHLSSLFCMVSFNLATDCLVGNGVKQSHVDERVRVPFH